MNAPIVAMPSLRSLAGLLLIFLLSSCVGVRQTMTPPPEIVTATPAKTDEMSVSYSNNATLPTEWEAVVDVKSETGIGAGSVMLQAGDWPSPLTLRLHLGGLEELRITAGDAVVELSVSSGPGQQVHQSLAMGGAPGQELTPASPYWLGLTAGESYYEVALPPALLPPGVEAFDIHWIDFYR